MKNNIKLVLSILSFFVLLGFAFGEPMSSKGIIAIQGESEMVAFCDGGMNYGPKPNIFGGIEWKESGVKYVLNNSEDITSGSLQKLRELANQECVRYFK